MGRIGVPNFFHQRSSHYGEIFSKGTGKKVESLIGVICFLGIDLKLPDVQMVE